jgi:hypothetical protein
MLATRLLKKKGNKEPLKGSCLLILIGLILIVASGVRIVGWFFAEDEAPLFVQQEGLVQTTTYEKARGYLESDYPLPTELFGSEISVFGVYTEATDYFDQGSLVVAYEKEGWRFVQISYLPSAQIEVELDKHFSYKTTEVTINEQTAYLVDIANNSYRCIESETEGVPSICTLTRSLIIQNENDVIIIASDGNHASDGELIGIARSIY